MPPFDAAEDAAQALEAGEVVAGEEAVDVRQRRAHAAGERLVVGVALERVHPDDGEGRAREALHLPADELGVVALPAVRDDHDDRAARQRAPAPDVVVGLQRRADARAAGPVGTRAAAASSAGSGSRAPSSGVSRVSRVPNANVSTPRPDPSAACR